MAHSSIIGSIQEMLDMMIREHYSSNDTISLTPQSAFFPVGLGHLVSQAMAGARDLDGVPMRAPSCNEAGRDTSSKPVAA